MIMDDPSFETAILAKEMAVKERVCGVLPVGANSSFFGIAYVYHKFRVIVFLVYTL